VLRRYSRKDWRADLRASLPVAAIALPQSMAFAMLAGFPPVYGIWTAIVAGIVGALVGSSHQLVTSVNNAVCMLVASLFAVLARQHPGDFHPFGAIVVLALLMGTCQVVMGVVGMGNLSRFISGSVLQGFMVGTAVLIAAHELGPLLGLATHHAEPLPLLRELAAQWRAVRFEAVAVGLGSIAIMLLPVRALGRAPGALVALLFSGAAVWALGLDPSRLERVPPVPLSLPTLGLPDVSWELFTDMVPGAIAAAILGAVEAITIGGAVASQTGQRVDNRWQLVGQGAANIASGVMGGLPASSSFTRSFLNLHEGARTQIAAALSGLWILAVVLVAGPLVPFVPRACLAGVLIVLASRLPDWSRVRLMLRTTREDAVALLVTFGATLVVRLDTALFIGVLVSLALYLRKAQTPQLVEYALDRSRRLQQVQPGAGRVNPAICMLHVEGDLFFAAADVLEREVRRIAQDPSLKVILLRMKSARHWDATSVLALADLALWLRGSGRHLLVSGVSGDAEKILARSGADLLLGRENIFFSKAGILHSTRDALLYAEKLVGSGGAEVRIFHDRPEEEFGTLEVPAAPPAAEPPAGPQPDVEDAERAAPRR
jgi:sulfate permease, SulP family